MACRNCRQCRKNRVNDLVGRCIAEQTRSKQTYAITLTYKGDGPGTAYLRYEDVQKFVKRLRSEGYTVRYIVADEYGSVKKAGALALHPLSHGERVARSARGN